MASALHSDFAPLSPRCGSCPLHFQDEGLWLDWLHEFGAEWWCCLSLRELFIMHSAAFIACLKSLVKWPFINSDCPKASWNNGGGNTDTQASNLLQDPKILQCHWQCWMQSPMSLSQARTMDPRQISPFKLRLLFMSFLQKWSSLFSTSQHSTTPQKPLQSRTVSEQLLVWDAALSHSDSRFHTALTVLI